MQCSHPPRLPGAAGSALLCALPLPPSLTWRHGSPRFLSLLPRLVDGVQSRPEHFAVDAGDLLTGRGSGADGGRGTLLSGGGGSGAGAVAVGGGGCGRCVSSGGRSGCSWRRRLHLCVSGCICRCRLLLHHGGGGGGGVHRGGSGGRGARRCGRLRGAAVGRMCGGSCGTIKCVRASEVAEQCSAVQMAMICLRLWRGQQPRLAARLAARWLRSVCLCDCPPGRRREQRCDTAALSRAAVPTARTPSPIAD